jgi:hypothetical protein
MNKEKNNFTRSTAYQILYWCIAEYGRSKLNGRYPHIEYRKYDAETEDEEEYGYFDEVEGVIVINKETNKTLTDLVQTIIHEYVHYRFHSMAEYRVLSKYLSHARNPLEIDARKIEKRDYKKCMKYLKKEYNID